MVMSSRPPVNTVGSTKKPCIIGGGDGGANKWQAGSFAVTQATA
jgi:hypothetical protein